MTSKIVAQLVIAVVIACSLLLMTAAASASELSSDSAAAVAQRLVGGRVLAVHSVTIDHRAAWRVKLLTRDGAVTVVLVDAGNGRVL